MSELQELKVPSQTELAVVNITEAARSIEVVDKPSADKASELIVAGKKLIKAIKDYFDPMKKAADEAKRRILETERQELGKIEPVVADLSAKVSRWLADEESGKMSSDILALIDGRDKAKASVAAYEKKIMAIICDAVRDIIPDIEGWLGTADNPNVLFFNSEIWSKDFPTADEEAASAGWWWLSMLIEQVFPELQFQVSDNGIYLPPEEQIEILKRLKRLRDGKETNNE